jgi:menaquinone-9 beta-reductase
LGTASESVRHSSSLRTQFLLLSHEVLWLGWRSKRVFAEVATEDGSFVIHFSMTPVTIIGGGLAGLTVGIGLRRQQVPVTIFEAGHYPRHRVCGEFISGRGQEVLERLGLLELLQSSGARPAHTVRFYLESEEFQPRRLKTPALCLSRFKLDALLAEQFRALGGELKENCRWRGSKPDSDLNRVSKGEFRESPDGVVFANGRRAERGERGCHCFGLKVHAPHAQLEADLEMHIDKNAYVGLCRLPDGEVNICGLFRRRSGEAPGRWQDLLRGRTSSSLHNRLAAASFDESSFCSVAGLPWRRQSIDWSRFCVGDAIAMIPPLTGNGMSIAFESAEMAIAPLTAYSRGELNWQVAQKTVSRHCAQTFGPRLAWAGLLHWMMFMPLAQLMLGTVLRSNPLWRFMLARTR